MVGYNTPKSSPQTSQNTKRRIDPIDLRYPYAAFDGDTDYLQIAIVNYISVGTLNGSAPGGRVNTKSQNATIFLPIPSSIQDGNSVDYSNSQLDSLTGAIASGVTDTINDVTNALYSGGGIGAATGMLAEKATGAVRTLSGNPAFRTNIVNNLVAQAANIPFGGNLTAAQILARQEGNILNPNMELLFNGVTLRSFKFSFRMTPRNKTESEQIRLIIRTLKKNMSAHLGGGENNYLHTPNIFELTYKTGKGKHKFLNSFKQCALSDMTVNYTGDNIYATYADGTPISMVMDLTFKELEPIYDSDYDTEEGQNGVGY
jgi:hypothetical protein